MFIPLFPLRVLPFLALLFRLTAQQNNNYSVNLVVEAFPQLRNLKQSPNTGKRLGLGGQDFDHCCLLAVNASILIGSDGRLTKNPDQCFISDDLDDFQNGQFPCGATYSPGDPGAPLVTIPYWWCRQNCSQWEASSSAKLNQWISPLAGFIVPAVVFCLAIPRRRKIYLFDGELFNVPLNKLTSTPSILLRAPFAAVLVSIDTVLWLLIVFALAGPILLSAVFEALLDKRVLEYLQEKVNNGRLSIEQRARIMYTTLLGNLDMHTGSGLKDGAWDHMNTHLIQRLKQDGVDSTKVCLNAMLACQYSFGVTVGAPVVFFGASFVYTLVENYGQYGNNDLSLALAFGEFLQVIPHVAIASGLLLAGNNPNTLAASVNLKPHVQPKVYFGIFAPVYEACYMPAWIWNRGRSKKLWFERLSNEFDPGDGSLHNRLQMSMGDWFLVGLLSYSLIVCPAILAILTAYFTVTVGLSCRSFTVLIYTDCQLCLIVLWIWEIESSNLRLGFSRRPSLKLQSWRGHRPQSYIWWTLVILCGSVSVFFAIGGTMMQIIGVYRNCLCLIPLRHWTSASMRNNFPIQISTDSPESIVRSRTWWKGTGAAAVAFLGISSFVGWWYQRLVKFQLRKLIDEMDLDAEDEYVKNGSVSKFTPLEIECAGV